jgi:hypothetical protein
MALTDIIKIVDVIIQLEKQISEAIAIEKDKKRRKKLEKAIKDRDLDTLRHILFDVE